MKRIYFLLSAICLLVMLLPAASQAQAAWEKRLKKDMKKMQTYYLVLLKRGPSTIADSAQRAQLMAGHLANIDSLAQAGVVQLAGPMLDGGELRGILVMKASSMAHAQQLAAADPAVRAGSLLAEVKPWYTKKGAKLR